MSDTTHLHLPLILASQAQKHVTHNEALLLLDALVHMSVIDRTRVTPPGAPAEGDRHIVAASATDAWAGRDDTIALYQDGDWDFLTPNPGWFAWVGAESTFVVWRGDAWTVIDTDVPDDFSFTSLGVNTGHDSVNKLSVKSNAVLFAPVEAADGGTGDVRFVIDKEAGADTASLLFQTGWEGRAELGLAGDDSFRLKVSADGTTWLDVFEVDADASLVVPAGAHVAAQNSGPLAGFRNYLVNGAFLINQRAFAGGSLTAGDYGYDRWKAGAGGASVTVSGHDVTLASGSLVQIIEEPDLAGRTVTVSLEDPSAPVSVDLDGVTGTIPAGSGRQGVTLTVPAASTGDLTLELAGTAATFSRAQLERGGFATPFEWRPAMVEEAMCRRYFQSVAAPEIVADAGIGGSQWRRVVKFLPVVMRAQPSTLDSSTYSGVVADVDVVGYDDRIFCKYKVSEAGMANLNFAATLDAEM